MAMALAVSTIGIGCGDDTTTGSGGNGSSGSTGSGSGSSTTVVADDSGGTTDAGSGNMEGSDSSSSSSGEPPPIEVTVEGQVVDFSNMAAPIPGAEISIFDLPGLSATADDMGLFSIGTFLANTTAEFVVAPNVDFFGAIIPAAIGEDTLQEDEQLAQIPRVFVDLQIGFLQQDTPTLDPDLTAAIIVVRLLNNTAVMEGPTTIEMDPPAPPDTFYAPDAAGAPVLNQNTIEFAALPVMVFFDVPDSSPGDISFTATHPTRDCEVLFPEFPTVGEHITLVDIQCLPPE